IYVEPAREDAQPLSWVVGLALDAVALGIEVRKSLPQEVLVGCPIVSVAGFVLVIREEVPVPEAGECRDLPMRQGDRTTPRSGPALLQLGLHGCMAQPCLSGVLGPERHLED